MKSSVAVISIIFLGIISLFLSRNFLLNSLKSYDKTNEKATLAIVMANGAGDLSFDTIRLRDNIPDIVFLNNEDSSGLKDSLTLNLKPKTLIYLTFHSIYISVVVMIVFFMLLISIRLVMENRVRLLARDTLMSLTGIILVIVFTVWLLYQSNSDIDRLYGGARIMDYFGITFSDPKYVTGTIVTVISVFAIIPLIIILVINITANSIGKSAVKKSDKILYFKKLKDDLNLIAFLSGVIVAGTIVGTSIQREMIADYIYNLDLLYPSEFIASYGLLFSFLLAIFFLPTLFHIKSYESTLVSAENSEESNSSIFRIGESTVQEVKLVFSVFLPLIAGIVQYFGGSS